ncbi:MAG: hypothetical protein U9Q73_03080 [Nanoarchaeota archaeon]|nr:hypothetical protein [Nanoarchaeota archaeon]
MKRILLTLLIGMFIVGTVSGADSDTQSNFTISGCEFGETGLVADSCSPEKDYFCSYEDGSYILYDTLYDNFGCSKGLATHIIGQPFCCPRGYVCENSVEGPICKLRVNACSDQLTQSDCEAAECYWLLIDGGICVETISDYSCDIYQTSETCTEDKFGLGQTGVGTEICGTYFTADSIGYVIPLESCHCKWDTICRLAYDTLEEIHNGTINSFECTKNFGIGDCINGTQIITWTATPQITAGYPSGVPLSVLEAAKCVDNAEGVKRECGLPTLKLFGFSLFSIFMSLGIVGLFYFLKELKANQD